MTRACLFMDRLVLAPWPLFPLVVVVAKRLADLVFSAQALVSHRPRMTAGCTVLFAECTTVSLHSERGWGQPQPPPPPREDPPEPAQESPPAFVA